MKYELTNGAMSASVSTLGAELVSLKRDGKEYLWQGDPAYWHGQSPLLFPNCGSFYETFDRLVRDCEKNNAFLMDSFARSYSELKRAALVDVTATQLSLWGGDMDRL
ncbi:MAG: hypothetical protein J6J53_02960, partial [Muribaculaceae bacterium]|nr:hypothetical protein [Muribaculaceae bacterium]